MYYELVHSSDPQIIHQTENVLLSISAYVSPLKGASRKRTVLKMSVSSTERKRVENQSIIFRQLSLRNFVCI